VVGGPEQLIDTKPQSLIERIRACEKVRDDVLTKFDEQIKMYVAGLCGGSAISENHFFEYVSMRIGQVAFANPIVRVETTGGPEQRMEAKALQHALTRWCRDTRFQRLAEKLAMDSFFSFGVTVTKPEPAPGYEEAEDPIYWPSVTRLDQRCFGFDCQALSFEEARYAFHQVITDKRDLERLAEEDAEKPKDERSGWNLKAIKGLAGGVGLSKLTNYDENKTTDDSNLTSYYEVWIPDVRIEEENTPEKGYHGAIFTIAYDASKEKADEIREARDFWGPRWGPYTLYGIYTVPNKPWPLAPFQAAWKQIQDDNEHADVLDRSSRNYKRLVLVDETDRKLAKKIKDGKHDHVYTHAGFDKGKAAQFEIGGITDQMLAVKQITKDRAERMLGMSDAEKGMVTGDATATENAVAANAAQVRTSWQARKFWDACERNLRTVAHYLRAEDVIVPLGQQAEKDLGGVAPVYIGKITAEAWPRQRRQLMAMMPGLDLPTQVPEEMLEDAGKGTDDAEVTIEVGSMARKDEQTEKLEADAFLMTTLQVAAAMPQMPYVHWGDLLEEYGTKRGYPDLPRFFDLQALAEIQGLNIQLMAEGGKQGGQQGQQSETMHNQPRMGRTQQQHVPDSRSQRAALPGQVSGSRNGQKAQKTGSSY
jgi:hypothetical protein